MKRAGDIQIQQKKNHNNNNNNSWSKICRYIERKITEKTKESTCNKAQGHRSQNMIAFEAQRAERFRS